MDMFPVQCNCNIDVAQLSRSSSVTYEVFAHEGASVSSITYKTSSGAVTTHNPELPFRTTVELEKGETMALTAKGNPKNGSIILTYEVQEHNDASGMASSSVSKVWILKDGVCE
ncbi:hypothetical protein [Parapedobacter koreensis]|nr:hypothetical protein [Parapedobacter koreensis]